MYMKAQYRQAIFHITAYCVCRQIKASAELKLSNSTKLIGHNEVFYTGTPWKCIDGGADVRMASIDIRKLHASD